MSARRTITFRPRTGDLPADCPWALVIQPPTDAPPKTYLLTDQDADHLAAQMAAYGFGNQPATTTEVEWLRGLVEALTAQQEPKPPHPWQGLTRHDMAIQSRIWEHQQAEAQAANAAAEEQGR